jgi:hypothetical protein
MSYQAVNSRIGGLEPTKLGTGWNIEKWHVK